MRGISPIPRYTKAQPQQREERTWAWRAGQFDFVLTAERHLPYVTFAVTYGDETKEVGARVRRVTGSWCPDGVYVTPNGIIAFHMEFDDVAIAVTVIPEDFAEEVLAWIGK